jgi:effector-binding domain-containing protein
MVGLLLMAGLALVNCRQKKTEQPARSGWVFGGTEARVQPERQFRVRVDSTDDTVFVGSISRSGPYAVLWRDGIIQLNRWLADCRIQPWGGPFVVYLDSIDADSGRYEVNIPVQRGTKGSDKHGVRVKPWPPMRFAWVEYQGPYDRDAAAPRFAQLLQWIRENGYVAEGPLLHYYLLDPFRYKPESLESNVAVRVRPGFVMVR